MNFILLQAAEGGQGMYGNLILIGGIILIFYFFMIRPQQKRQKDQKRFLEELRKGDSVVTAGGIHGKIAQIDDDIVYMDIEKGGKLKLDKSSISRDSSKKTTEKK